MIRLRFLCVTAAAAVAALACGTASAGWGARHGGSHGSHGGGSYGGYASYGAYGGSTGGSSGYAASSSYAGYASYGSSGAAYGSSGGASYGSSGGDSDHVGPLRRLFARLHEHHAAKKAARHASHGSSGYASYSSYGGSTGGSSGYASHSYGSYGSTAGYGSTGGYGSSGGVYPAYQPSVIDGGYVPGPAVEGRYYDGGQPSSSGETGGETPPPPPAAEARLGNDAALLTVAVPESARVLVNGKPTTSQGPIRQFMSRGLKGGHSYTYVVEMQATVDGQPISDRKTIRLRAGDAERLVFSLPSPRPAETETALTLHVPADAQVTLAGNPTAMDGETRTFRTRQLAAGEAWDDYTIQVAVVRDGQRLTQEKKIRLEAGAQQQLTFDFEQDQVALASR